jgi:hypothetical protein
MADATTPDPDAQVRELYEQAESQTAQAFEQLVSKPSFGVLLARSAENVAALTRIGSDVADLVLRNLRLAGRADVTRLARQLHRTEDKLERLLQEVEQLRDELPRTPSTHKPRAPSARRARAQSVRGSRAQSVRESRGNGTDSPMPTRTPS